MANNVNNLTHQIGTVEVNIFDETGNQIAGGGTRVDTNGAIVIHGDELKPTLDAALAAAIAIVRDARLT